MDEPGKQALQQLLAQPLPLRHLELKYTRDLPVLNMAALCQLEEFWSSNELPASCVLPAQLQRLTLYTCSVPSSLQVLTGLQQLQRLTLSVMFNEAQPLLHLALLPALQHITLQVYGETAAAGTASAWPLLPQLQDLNVSYVGKLREEQWEAVTAGVASCTGLTAAESDSH
jgi:hypothetical protein